MFAWRLIACSFLLAGHTVGQAIQQPLGGNSVSRRSSRDELLSLHRSLVEIESISGNEYAVGNFLVEYLTNRGYGADLQFLDSKSNQGRARFNVLAWPGKSTAPKPRILVSSHIDVVPPYIPYSIADGPITEKTMISGRGSVDAKASVAAQIIALEELLSDKKVKENDAMLLFVVGEETSGDGMRFFSDAMDKLQSPPNFEAVIFGEPTENKLACGHKGSLSCVLEAQGHAGHSGYPWLGKSANELIVKAVSAIVDADLGSSEEFGNTTTNIGILDGGIALNVIPEHSTAKFMCRVAIGTEENGNHVVEAKIREIIVGIDPTAFKLSCSPGYGVVKTACDVEGFETITVNYGTDVPNLKGDHKRYLYGPGTILVAHSAQENLTVADLETAVEGYKKLILHALDAQSS